MFIEKTAHRAGDFIILSDKKIAEVLDKATAKALAAGAAANKLLDETLDALFGGGQELATAGVGKIGTGKIDELSEKPTVLNLQYVNGDKYWPKLEPIIPHAKPLGKLKIDMDCPVGEQAIDGWQELIPFNPNKVEDFPVEGVSSWEEFYKKKKFEHSEAEKLAERVANACGLQKNATLSTKNGRTVYSAEKLNYLLATDTQHACFEVCTKNGTHLGEVNFLGVKTKNAQKNHDLNIK